VLANYFAPVGHHTLVQMHVEIQVQVANFRFLERLFSTKGLVLSKPIQCAAFPNFLKAKFRVISVPDYLFPSDGQDL
jgi:hypothetical protein